jgi:hypothetical protein
MTTESKADQEATEVSGHLKRGVSCDLATFAKTILNIELQEYQKQHLDFLSELIDTVPDKNAKIRTVRRPRQDGVAYYAQVDDRSWRYVGSGKWESN